jgi:transcriptional regulator with XRE-family HTH domain
LAGSGGYFGVTDKVGSRLIYISRWLGVDMSIKTLRERKALSQEQLAEVSGLSLRTIQRVEAGHRVSFASLRALAAIFDVDVDSLERELYAMSKSTDGTFVEIPLWARVLNGSSWYKGPRPSRRDSHLLEIVLLSLAIVCLLTSFLVQSELTTRLLRFAALFEFICCYIVSASIRIIDTYKLWPSTDLGTSGSAESFQSFLPRSRIAGYTLYLVVPILFMALLFWLAV